MSNINNSKENKIVNINKSILRCPVCKSGLEEGEKTFSCKNNHSYDISKKGYVNLLMSNASKKKRHGDDKAMVCARTEFLDLGYYQPLANEISSLAVSYPMEKDNVTIFECGCGECYYINEVKKAFDEKKIICNLYGMDISKDVLPYGKKRIPSITLFAASAFKLPVMDNSIDVAMSIFAPMDMNEMARVLNKGGFLIKIIPLEEHLIELKRQLYKEVYLNRPEIEYHKCFEMKEYKKLEYKFDLNSTEEIESLFKMTPYYYKTSAEAQRKLVALNNLEVTASFGVCLYVKK
jgi:23S rRNA (guanine745-N1)-methyltransferase